MTTNEIALLALTALLAFAAGWIGCAAFTEITTSTVRRGYVDLTRAAARGELLHLDWGDTRVTHTDNVTIHAPRPKSLQLVEAARAREPNPDGREHHAGGTA